MSEPRRCPQCGNQLPPDAPAGLCPHCLLNQGRESASGADIGSSDLPPTTPTSGGFVPPHPDELAPQFPNLEVMELVGTGGMGAVYRARQPHLDRLVALKILPSEVGEAPAFQERFIREARALAKLGHPHIVAIYDFGQADGLYYFLMEYVDGANIRQLIQQGDLKPEEALAIVPQICEALQYAHDEGIVHRDIKPENILVDKKGRVKIADFGLAKLIGKPPKGVTLTGTQQVMGTLHYIAPEQMKGAHPVDHRADIYSLGVVFYEMLTGELPIGKFEPPSNKVSVDIRLDEVVLRALENKPERRYQMAGEVKTDVERISSSRPAGVPPPALPPSSPADGKLIESVRQLVRRPAIWLILTGVVKGITGVLLVLSNIPVEWRIDAREFATALTIIVSGAIIVFGGWLTLRLQNYIGGVVAGGLALLALLTPVLGEIGSGPWALDLISVPVGIWALAVLMRPEVKAAFAQTLNDN